MRFSRFPQALSMPISSETLSQNLEILCTTIHAPGISSASPKGRLRMPPATTSARPRLSAHGLPDLLRYLVRRCLPTFDRLCGNPSVARQTCRWSGGAHQEAKPPSLYPSNWVVASTSSVLQRSQHLAIESTLTSRLAGVLAVSV